MNIKRVFGALLTILGIAGLIYAATLLMGTRGGAQDVKAISIFGILGIVFFTSGIGLVRTMRDDAA